MNSYFTPCAAIWYQSWRRHITRLKVTEDPQYSQAAMVANIEYNCALALKV